MIRTLAPLALAAALILPLPALAQALPEPLLAIAGRSRGRGRAVGDPAHVVAELERFVTTYDLDELIVTTYTHDPALRVRSMELLAQSWGLPA